MWASVAFSPHLYYPFEFTHYVKQIVANFAGTLRGFVNNHHMCKSQTVGWCGKGPLDSAKGSGVKIPLDPPKVIIFHELLATKFALRGSSPYPSLVAVVHTLV